VGADAPQTTVETDKAQRIDPKQLQDSYVAPRMTESNYIIGPQPGVRRSLSRGKKRSQWRKCSLIRIRWQPYVVEHSHNMYARLGARMAFLGIDARTEVRLSAVSCRNDTGFPCSQLDSGHDTRSIIQKRTMRYSDV